ncbi:hypothetical protein ACLOJK_014597 [Asimina triloba]
MSTVLAFGFMPRGGFSLSDGKSFDLAIPHQFIHVPASITGGPPRPSPRAATPAPQSIHKTVSATVAASLAPRLSPKAATIVAMSSAPRSSQRVVSATTAASSAYRRIKRRSRKVGSTSRRTTRLNRQDAQPFPPDPRYGVSHAGSRRCRKAPTTTPKKKVMIAVKRGDLPPGWCYPPCRHSTYPRLVAD